MQKQLVSKAFEQPCEARMPCLTRRLSGFYVMFLASATRLPSDQNLLELHGIEMQPQLPASMIVAVADMPAHRALVNEADILKMDIRVPDFDNRSSNSFKISGNPINCWQWAMRLCIHWHLVLTFMIILRHANFFHYLFIKSRDESQCF